MIERIDKGSAQWERHACLDINREKDFPPTVRLRADRILEVVRLPGLNVKLYIIW